MSSRSTSSSIGCAPRPGSITGIFDVIVLGLPQHETRQGRGLYRRLEDVPECDDDVLGGRNGILHERDVEIEVPVIDDIDYLLLHDVLERAEIHDVTGALLDLTGH